MSRLDLNPLITAKRSFEEEDKERGLSIYYNRCCICRESFTGHKRRVTCKLCLTPKTREQTYKEVLETTITKLDDYKHLTLIEGVISEIRKALKDA